MLKVQIVKTASGARAVQVVYYSNRKTKVFKHIGSGHTDDQVEKLQTLAIDFINRSTPLLFFDGEPKVNDLLSVEKSEFIGIYYSFFYEVIQNLFKRIGLDVIRKNLLLDLVIMRIFEPASKLQSISLLEQYFGIRHRRQSFYESAPKWLALKDKTEDIVLNFAKQHYNFNFDLIFYDVTTLYFETFVEDNLRKNGFSKDNKSQQPQILIALMVTKDGFPIAYEIFSGNTFEGHTIIPVIKALVDRNKVREFTVVADAAMISLENIKQLIQNKINYIVGARIGSLSADLLEIIDKQINRQDGKSIRIKTDLGYLICSYSSVRYRKDLYEMNKQIEKAKQVIESPSKTRKTKFTKTGKQQLELNEELIEKTKKLLGIKGYYTNIEETITDNKTIIDRYHELYRIEQAFRVSKSDLQTRPIFHFKEEPIKLHILICFMALVISKHIEIKSGISIRKFLDKTKKIVDGQILNQITGKTVSIRAEPSEKMNSIIGKLFPPH